MLVINVSETIDFLLVQCTLGKVPAWRYLRHTLDNLNHIKYCIDRVAVWGLEYMVKTVLSVFGQVIIYFSAFIIKLLYLSPYANKNNISISVG